MVFMHAHIIAVQAALRRIDVSLLLDSPNHLVIIKMPKPSLVAFHDSLFADFDAGVQPLPNPSLPLGIMYGDLDLL